MASLLVVSTDSVDGIVTITCSGDLHDALAVASAVEAVVAEAPLKVRVDCSGLGVATEEGMKDLLRAINRCDEVNIPVELILPSDAERFLELVDIGSDTDEGLLFDVSGLLVSEGPVEQPVG